MKFIFLNNHHKMTLCPNSTRKILTFLTIFYRFLSSLINFILNSHCLNYSQWLPEHLTSHFTIAMAPAFKILSVYEVNGIEASSEVYFCLISTQNYVSKIDVVGECKKLMLLPKYVSYNIEQIDMGLIIFRNIMN